MKVLITGAGGPGCEALARQWKSHDLYFADIDVERVHPSIASERKFEIPNGKDPLFTGAIIALVKKLSIEIIISQVDEELEKLNQVQQLLEGVKLISPAPDFVSVCNDKAKLGKVLNIQGIAEPNTERLSELTQKRPNDMILKPRFGRGSRGLFYCRKGNDFEGLKNYLLSCGVPYVIQNEIQGVEYTVQVIANKLGKIKAVVPVRVFEKRGSTTRCQIELNEVVIETTKKIHETFLPQGTYNIQYIYDSMTKTCLVIEINPRVSTTLCLAVESGIDPIELFSDESRSFVVPSREIRLNRYWINEFSETV